MGEDSQRVLTIQEAAGIIYNTREPTAVELGKVHYLLDRGLLKGTKKGHWTTTPQAVADFLTAQALHAQHAGTSKSTRRAARSAPATPNLHAQHAGPSKSTSKSTSKSPASAAAPRGKSRGGRAGPKGQENLSGLYREILVDYFLAVMRRRTVEHRSRAFARAVLVGQVGLLVLLVALPLIAYRLTRVVEPPEHAVVRQWLTENTEQFEVLEWFPVEPDLASGGSRVRLRYSYKDGGTKTIETDRIFVVEAGRVSAVDNSDLP